MSDGIVDIGEADRDQLRLAIALRFRTVPQHQMRHGVEALRRIGRQQSGGITKIKRRCTVRRAGPARRFAEREFVKTLFAQDLLGCAQQSYRF
jgi:hypothetical protein